MRNPFFYVLLLVLIIIDGWLLSHPNLIGRAGVFFFEQDYLETFPKALGTVATVVGIAVVVAQLSKQTGQVVASVVLAALLAVTGYWLWDSFTLYNSGVYKLMGSSYRAGAILLPGLLTLVFAKNLFDLTQSKSRRR